MSVSHMSVSHALISPSFLSFLHLFIHHPPPFSVCVFVCICMCVCWCVYVSLHVSHIFSPSPSPPLSLSLFLGLAPLHSPQSHLQYYQYYPSLPLPLSFSPNTILIQYLPVLLVVVVSVAPLYACL